MIGFRPAGFVKNRLKSRSNRKWLPPEEEESHHSDYSDAESEKVKKKKKVQKISPREVDWYFEMQTYR